MSLVTSAPNISQCVAAQIRAFRRRQDLTLAQLADKCAELGAPQLSFSSLANIERGATAESRRKPRDVSLDELAILARALNVPPVMLLFPIGTSERVQITPEVEITAWDAAQWFSGELFLTPDVETHLATPVYLFRQHTKWMDDFLGAGEAERDSRRAETEQALRSVRAEMRRHGLTPPNLPPELKHIDETRALRLAATGSLTAEAEVIPPVPGPADNED